MSTRRVRARDEPPRSFWLASFNPWLTLTAAPRSAGARTEGGGCDQRDQRGEPQRSRVERHEQPLGDIAARDAECGHEIEAPPRKKASQPAAGHKQQQVLDQQLPAQTPAARAERGADRALPLAGDRACEEEVGDIHARYEEHQRDSTEHQAIRLCSAPGPIEA